MITGTVQPSEQLEKPRRLSDLALSIGIIVLDWLNPNDFQRGAIAMPESIKKKRRRRASYDQLRSPPPEFVSHAEEAVGKRRERGTGVGGSLPGEEQGETGEEANMREGQGSRDGLVGKSGTVGVEEVS